MFSVLFEFIGEMIQMRMFPGSQFPARVPYKPSNKLGLVESVDGG